MTEECDRILVQQLLHAAGFNIDVNELSVQQFDLLCPFSENWKTQMDAFSAEDLHGVVNAFLTGEVIDREMGQTVSIEELTSEEEETEEEEEETEEEEEETEEEEEETEEEEE